IDTPSFNLHFTSLITD
ncbi:UDP-3-O-(3-hydroxymyristoyl)glucosamine N-acyltransferase, partial [Haemophilus influenzae]